MRGQWSLYIVISSQLSQVNMSLMQEQNCDICGREHRSRSNARHVSVVRNLVSILVSGRATCSKTL